MKKTMMIAATMLLVVAGSQASTLKWNGNGTTAAFKGLSNVAMTVGGSSQTASMIAYYILAADLPTVQNAIRSEVDFVALGKAKATGIGQTSTSTSAAGRFAGSLPGITGSAAGIVYFVRVYATFGTKDYFIDVKNGNSAYWLTSVSGPDATPETLSWAATTYGGATGVNGDFNK